MNLAYPCKRYDPEFKLMVTALLTDGRTYLQGGCSEVSYGNFQLQINGANQKVNPRSSFLTALHQATLTLT